MNSLEGRPSDRSPTPPPAGIAGHRGDIVRVSDGRAALYLFPWEFDAAGEPRLRWLLAQRPRSTGSCIGVPAAALR